MTLLGWFLVTLAILMVTGLLGPVLGVVLSLAALPFLAIAGVVLFPLVLVVMVVGMVFGAIGFVLHWGLPLLVLGAGVWVLTRDRRPRLPA